MKNIMLIVVILTTLICQKSLADSSFSLPGDGKWYRLASVGGRHAYIVYNYAHSTAFNPSISVGELEFINSRNTLIQHHQTMGYAGWNQPQFALINFGGGSEVWVKATPGVDTGTFTITYSIGAGLNLGDLSDADPTDNGGTLTIYDKLKDDADTFYTDIILPANSLSVGTGNIDPNYKLAVKGNIHALGVKVETTNWPDYVFKPAYHLQPLPELENYIGQNHHLPEMPTEDEVIKQGVNLGEMVKLQTKKIEELTLYLIEKDKQAREQQLQIDQLKMQQEMINQQQKQIDDLKQEIKALANNSKQIK